jgi:hypothetical protein
MACLRNIEYLFLELRDRRIVSEWGKFEDNCDSRLSIRSWRLTKLKPRTHKLTNVAHMSSMSLFKQM